MDLVGLLGLELGDAHVIRNAGGVVTDDAIRSLAISQRLLGTREIVLLHHTDCGMQKFSDDEFKRSIQDETGIKPAWAAEAFGDLDEDVRRSIGPHPGEPVHPPQGLRARLRLRRPHPARCARSPDPPQRNDLPDLVGPGIGEPQVIVRTTGNPVWFAPCGKRVFGDCTASGDLADLARAGVREPQIAVWASRDLVRFAARRQRIFGDRPAGRDLPDLARAVLHEPQIFVRSGGHPSGSLPADSAYSVITPAVVIFPILTVPSSVNHRLPSGPL